MTDLNLETIERKLDTADYSFSQCAELLGGVEVYAEAIEDGLAMGYVLLEEVRRLDSVDEDARRKISERLGLTVAGESPSCLADFEDEIVRLREHVTNLRACLEWYVAEDDVQEGGRWEGSNDYWINGKRRAIAVLEETKAGHE